MREILAWTVKCSLLIFIIAGFILMIERLRVSVVLYKCMFYQSDVVLGYIDKRIELDLHTEDTVYLGVVKTSVSCYNNLVAICGQLYIILTLPFLLRSFILTNQIEHNHLDYDAVDFVRFTKSLSHLHMFTQYPLPQVKFWLDSDQSPLLSHVNQRVDFTLLSFFIHLLNPWNANKVSSCLNFQVKLLSASI